jgi:hypothetical protein
VSAGERIDPDRKVAGGDVIVGMTQARRNELYADLILAGVIDVEVDDFVPPWRLLDYRAAASHKHSAKL